MLSPYVYDLHFQALWSSDSENYINSSSLDKLIILSKLLTQKERIHLHYSKIIVFVCFIKFV